MHIPHPSFPCWRTRGLILCLGASAGWLAGIPNLSAQEPPVGFGKPDAEIAIGVVPGQMKYDTESFGVRPGSKVKLTLTNPDVMQHNLVICQSGKDMISRVAQAAATLGGDAIKKQFIPEIPEVLFHTNMVDPGQSFSIYFTAPAAEGDYPFVCTFPGHALVMNGIMKVNRAGTATPGPKPNRRPPDSRNVVTVTDEPRIARVLLPDASPASLAVGLVGGFNYCFDTENCAVRYGWTGSFLNVAGDLEGRGGKVCEVLGPRFDVGYVEFPLRLANDKPVVKFLGYRMKTVPEIVFSVDGVTVTQTVAPAPGTTPESPALLYTFSIPRATTAVRFLTKPDAAQISSPAGSPIRGVITIPAKNATQFTVTVTPAKGAKPPKF